VLKAIETSYKGYRFRSRLEARWAVFFDHIGVKWEYEPEGFEFKDGSRYLPDFRLPDVGMWVEVKPTEKLSDDEKQKIDNLVCESEFPVYVTSGAPGVAGQLHYRYTQQGGEVNILSCLAIPDWKCSRVWVDYSNDCDDADYSQVFFKGNMDEDSDEDKTFRLDLYSDAINASRAARFEFGERG